MHIAGVQVKQLKWWPRNTKLNKRYERWDWWLLNVRFCFILSIYLTWICFLRLFGYNSLLNFNFHLALFMISFNLLCCFLHVCFFLFTLFRFSLLLFVCFCFWWWCLFLCVIFLLFICLFALFILFCFCGICCFCLFVVNFYLFIIVLFCLPMLLLFYFQLWIHELTGWNVSSKKCKLLSCFEVIGEKHADCNCNIWERFPTIVP